MRDIPIEPYKLKRTEKRICTFDTETDPFAEGRIVKPFSVGFYVTDTRDYFDFWGDDCIAQFFDFLASNFADEELLIYAHNGGNFDFYFCLDYFDSGSKPFIINGRLVRVIMQGQEFRDSYAAIPVAMSAYAKVEIDYAKMESDVREKHKEEILHYLRKDCEYLGELVTAFHNSFGDKLTMASVALPMLRSFHGFEETDEKTDEYMRSYYYGGRCQAFEVGELHDDFKIYDVNSMYPYVMAEAKHPISSLPIPQTGIDDETCFAKISAISKGALPLRAEDGSLYFPRGEGIFYATGHEIRAGLETKTLAIICVHEAFKYECVSTFKDFVTFYYEKRLEAKASGDALNTLFLKLVLNSSYGKFAQDSRRYETHLFDPDDAPKPLVCLPCRELLNRKIYMPCDTCLAGSTSPLGWHMEQMKGDRLLWSRPQAIIGDDNEAHSKGFFNVATAASITGAARAELWRGICGANRPVYCDTDSIICRSLGPSVVHDEKKLGGWKTEAEGDTACIAGKKLYAVFNKGEEVKKASKGVRLTAEQIQRVCKGETIEYINPVPKFKLDGSSMFINRKISRTT